MYPKLYEVNTRVWIRQFGPTATLADVPDHYLHHLVSQGIDRLWLMGVWQNCVDIIQEHAFHPNLVETYQQVLLDWTKDDVIGSPYSIDSYQINAVLGSEEDLITFRKRVNRAGIKLYLDFVPNHFGASSRHITSNPEVFFEANTRDEKYNPGDYFFYEPVGKYFFRGKDPYFPPWTDTVQVNYAESSARQFMLTQLLRVAERCDGVRCDMAMLVINKVFRQTWQNVLTEEQQNFLSDKEEFWIETIKKVKFKYPKFEFLAEAYWDLEWMLQQHGFDYTYDKRLLDRLAFGNSQTILGHLKADMHYQNRLTRFIENHDEERALTKLGLQRSKAAAVIISTLPGMKFYYDGQFEGKSVHLPVQLGRSPHEIVLPTLRAFYYRLLNIISLPHFFMGTWTLLDVQSSGWEDPTYQSLLAWEWHGAVNHFIIIVNYTDGVSSGRIFGEWDGYGQEVILEDLLNDQEYLRQVDKLIFEGLSVILNNYQSHIFKVIPVK